MQVDGRSLFVFQDRTFRLLSIELKYGPWRDALVRAHREVALEWAQAQRPLPEKTDLRDRARFIYQVLVRLCMTMDGVVPEAWIKHMGHNISHCSGPVPMLTKMGVIRRAAQSMVSGGQGVMCFGKLPRYKRFCCNIAERSRALRQISHHVALADELGDVQAPRTCAEWVVINAGVVNHILKSRSAAAKRFLMICTPSSLPPPHPPPPPPPPCRAPTFSF